MSVCCAIAGRQSLTLSTRHLHGHIRPRFSSSLHNTISPSSSSNAADAAVRVRFAPSPTGMLHLGGLRTALFNQLFARHLNGTFILRIEDTDQSRTVPGAVEKLVEVLEWANIKYDEGPHVGGGYGPYVQSQRLSIYQDHIQRLLKSGNAYRCFCSSERLDQVRERAKRTGNIIGYDGKCRHLSMDQIQQSLDNGDTFTIRLKVPQSGATVFQDLVRGPVSFNNIHLDDSILLKSDGMPTYHFANVIDDHLMRISHVLRGEEWVASTPKHVLLYEAFGWTPPRFAHLPLLCNADGSKLSKRSGDVHVESFRSKGFLPEALTNYVAFLGWSPGSTKEFFTMQELVKAFVLENVNMSPSIVTHDKLTHLNKLHLWRILSPSAEDLSNSSENLIKRQHDLISSIHANLKMEFANELDEWGLKRINNLEYVSTVVKAVKERIRLVPEFPNFCRPFFLSPNTDLVNQMLKSIAKTDQDVDKHLLQKVVSVLQNVKEWEHDIIKSEINSLAKTEKCKFVEIVKPLRIVLTGQLVGIDLMNIIQLLGKESTIKRIKSSQNNNK